MAKGGKSKGGWTPAWLRHKALVGAEAALLTALLMELAQREVQGSGLPNWGKVLWLMGVNLGLLGGLVLFTTAAVGRVVDHLLAMVQELPIPLPILVLHLLAFSGLGLLYAWVFGLFPLFPRH